MLIHGIKRKVSKNTLSRTELVISHFKSKIKYNVTKNETQE